MSLDKIELAEAIESLRDQVADAVQRATNADLKFPLRGLSIELQVGLTRTTTGEIAANLWVLTPNVSGSFARETIQKVTIELGPPAIGTGDTRDTYVSGSERHKPS